jgi:predicted PurR-regulated permease PerM
VQDYVLGPRILGHAVGLPPLVTLVSVSVIGVVLGPASVPIATPLACIVVANLGVVLERP